MNPDQISGLQFWYDASQETASDNDAITPADWSGNGAALTGTVTYKTNIVNSLPVFRFSNNVLFGSKANYNFLHQGSHTLFVVLKSSDGTNRMSILDTCNLGGDGFACMINRTVLRSLSVKIVNNNSDVYSDDGIGPYERPDVFSLDTWNVLVYRLDSDLERYEVWQNGHNVRYFEKKGELPTVESSFSPAWGRQSGTAFGYFTGDMAEMFAYNRALSFSEINSLVGATISTYGAS